MSRKMRTFFNSNTLPVVVVSVVSVTVLFALSKNLSKSPPCRSFIVSLLLVFRLIEIRSDRLMMMIMIMMMMMMS